MCQEAQLVQLSSVHQANMQACRGVQIWKCRIEKWDLHVYLRVDQTGQSLALEQLLVPIVFASIAASCALVL